MNTKNQKTITTTLTVLLAVLITTTVVKATGTLTPSVTAGDDTQYTLNDIYNKLTDFSISTDEGIGAMTIPGTVEATFATLSEIYGLLEAEEADLVPENIKSGITIFGVEGSYTAAPTTLEWSTNQGPMNWDTAVATCAGTVDGRTGWRLPTISELLAGISDDWITEGDVQGNRFASYTFYWSGTELDGSTAWYAYWIGSMYGSFEVKTNDGQVFCVR